MTKYIITTRITDLAQIETICKLVGVVYIFLLISKLDSVVFTHNLKL